MSATFWSLTRGSITIVRGQFLGWHHLRTVLERCLCIIRVKVHDFKAIFPAGISGGDGRS